MKLGMLVAVALLTTFGFTTSVLTVEKLSSNASTKTFVLAQSTWQQFTSSAGKFTVQMPGNPKEETSPKEIKGQTVSWHRISFANDAEVYSVIYSDLPNTYFQATDSQTILDEMGEMVLMERRLEELKNYEQPISLNGNPGLEFRVSNSDGALVVRLYLVQQRIYCLLTASETVKDVNVFLSSFQLL